MTATKPPAAYTSGHCGARAHERCRGAYAGTTCDCTCHDEPEPEPVVVTVHCFFGCEHVTRSEDPQAAHDAMERHYFDAHRPQIRAAIGWMNP